ncbi:MAG: general secretion pathway protein GspK [Acidobacteriota bacterium]|nr:general secretion pathway protein GspK [Acidobacteriota bacterium]
MKRANEGAALLAVLWLSAALSAIAFSVASTVRGETERAATSVDDVRSYYLATGAIQRAILHYQWGPEFYRPGTPVLHLHFPSGESVVEIIPETAKLNINSALPEDLYRLLIALGENGSQASELTAAIVDWRTPAPENKLSPFDAFYLSLSPSFRSPHASFQEIEELLSVKGMTPDLFYGTYERETRSGPPRLVAKGGLRDCVSTHGAVGSFEINTASPAVLLAAGLAPDQVAALVQRREQQPFTSPDEVRAFASGLGPAGEHLRLGGNTIYTFRATVRLRLQNGQLSDMQRTVAALISFKPSGFDATFHVMRWYDRG